jgi:hypothetical protein
MQEHSPTVVMASSIREPVGVREAQLAVALNKNPRKIPVTVTIGTL